MKLLPLVAMIVATSLPGVAWAQADDGVAAPGLDDPRRRGTVIRGDHPEVVVPEPGVAFVPPSRILYLNDCKPDGCRILPGDRSDSRLDESTLVDVPRTLSPYAGTAASWSAIVACVRANYAPYTLQVVTEDPGNVPHFEAIGAGVGREAGFPDSGGVSPGGCGIIPNSITLSFLNLAPNDVDWGCAVLSQESGHSFGLDHSMLAADVMTYIPEPRRKSFVDQWACVGTQGCCQPESECRCGLFEQNSHQRLLQSFGRAGETPPDIIIDEPGNGASVLPGFPVRATIIDWDGVGLVELRINDVLIGSVTAPPYELRAPADLVPGIHRVTVRATDALGFVAQVNVDVMVDEPCPDDASCAAITPGHVCTDGRCVAGPPAPVSESGGCAAGGGAGETAPMGTLALVGLVLGGLAFRRGRRTDMCQRHMPA